jgi:hypothetical protein
MAKTFEEALELATEMQEIDNKMKTLKTQLQEKGITEEIAQNIAFIAYHDEWEKIYKS